MTSVACSPSPSEPLAFPPDSLALSSNQRGTNSINTMSDDSNRCLDTPSAPSCTGRPVCPAKEEGSVNSKALEPGAPSGTPPLDPTIPITKDVPADTPASPVTRNAVAPVLEPWPTPQATPSVGCTYGQTLHCQPSSFFKSLSLQLTPDEELEAVTTHSDGKVRVWRNEGVICLLRPFADSCSSPNQGPIHASFNPRNRGELLVSKPGGLSEIWNWAVNPPKLSSYLLPETYDGTLSYHPREAWVVFLHQGRLHFSDTSTGASICTVIPSAGRQIVSFIFYSDHSRVLVVESSEDCEETFWNRWNFFLAVHAIPSGEFISCCKIDDNINSLKPLQPCIDSTRPRAGFAAGRRGSRGSEVLVWDIDEAAKGLAVEQYNAKGLAASPDMQTLVLRKGNDPTLTIVEGGSITRTLAPEIGELDRSFQSVSMLPGGKRLALLVNQFIEFWELT